MKRLFLLCLLVALPIEAFAQPRQVITNCGTQTLVAGDSNNGYITTNGLDCVSGLTSGGLAGITATSKSGAFTGASQVLMAANPNRVGCTFQPQTVDGWYNIVGTSAAAVQPSHYLPAPGEFSCPAGFKGVVSVFGATPGATFGAEEFTVP